MTVRDMIYGIYARILTSQCQHLPNHIAIIQDGNRRYARTQGISAAEGHRAGADTTEKMLDWARELGIRHITLYCFSTENFTRSREEVDELITLFREELDRVVEDPRIHTNRIRVQVLGDRSLLPTDLLASVERAEKVTREYGNYFINLALAYGGRNEIVRAAKDLLGQVKGGRLRAEEIDPAMIEHQLYSEKQIPPVDLIVRTGNEHRTSNFLPWLANGNECAVYFCAPNWPAFRKVDLLRAIRVYDQRIRLQKGKTSGV
ncbi:MAG: polyprenyl diphosphate synthase [Methanomicrobiales archaeon]|nr:polyprenyl diphosphate synthase [Methanomicrobiales archaeon]